MLHYKIYPVIRFVIIFKGVYYSDIIINITYYLRIVYFSYIQMLLHKYI